MDKNTLRKVQLTQLEILKKTKHICEKYGLTYWLDSGTLLGAVRHKGFIPWDDDLDIGMFRDDYEKFLRIAPLEFGEFYHLQQWKSDNCYGLSFAKVRKAGTVYIETKSQKSSAENGIYIDIFPYDNYGNRLWCQGIPLKVIKSIMQVKSGMRTWYDGERINYLTLLKNIPSLFLSAFFGRDYLINKYERIATRYNHMPCKYYFAQGISNYGKNIIPIDILGSFGQIQFEDDLFTVPLRYDDFLTICYGDYMKLPPEDRRENRHQIIEIKF